MAEILLLNEAIDSKWIAECSVLTYGTPTKNSFIYYSDPVP